MERKIDKVFSVRDTIHAEALPLDGDLKPFKAKSRSDLAESWAVYFFNAATNTARIKRTNANIS